MVEHSAQAEALLRVTFRNEAYQLDAVEADIDTVFSENADATDRDDALALAYLEGFDKTEAQAEAEETLAAWADLDREAVRRGSDWPSPDFW